MTAEYGSPEASEAVRWAVLAVLMTIVGIILVFMFSGLTEGPSIARECADRGGVLVRSASGPWVCVREVTK